MDQVCVNMPLILHLRRHTCTNYALGVRESALAMYLSVKGVLQVVFILLDLGLVLLS